MPDSHADELEAARRRVAQLVHDLDLEGKRFRFEELQELAGRPELWDDPNHARSVTTELSAIEQEVARLAALTERVDDLEVLEELAQEEDDPSSAVEVTSGLAALEADLDRYELATLLSGEHDSNDAIVSVHAGEGG
ncbi:MAG: PCRF domain-containing protein, partial [Nitriliruptor sp.]|uniref:PCRF domain-containing protein n=1 Tax=Nitriliruptor sp. TaxID=2448056 RepID=UPI00349FDC75